MPILHVNATLSPLPSNVFTSGNERSKCDPWAKYSKRKYNNKVYPKRLKLDDFLLIAGIKDK